MLLWSDVDLLCPEDAARLNPKHAMNLKYDGEDTSLFLNCVQEMMKDTNIKRFLTWNQNYTSLVIIDTEQFSRVMLQKYFPYTHIDIFSANLHACGFCQSYPPPGEQDDIKYLEDLKKEFVRPHSFMPTRAPLDEIIAKELEQKEIMDSKEKEKEKELLQIGESLDKELSLIKDKFINSVDFIKLAKEKMGLSALFTSETPFHEDVIMLKQVFLNVCFFY